MATDLGRDTFCADSLRAWRAARGGTLVAQRLYHALITPRGALLGGDDEASFGEDLEELIGADAGKQTEREIKTKVDRAASKDETITKITTSVVTTQGANGSVSHEVTIDAETGEGPFRLVLAVGDVDVALVGLSAEAA